MTVESLAQSLYSARLNGTRLEQSDTVTSLEQAYELQASLTQLHSETVSGWKIGATTEAAQQTLGIEKPFHGPLHAPFHQIHASTDNKEVSIYSTQPTIVETEFVVGLGRDLPDTGQVSIEDVAASTLWVAPGFELVGTRFVMDLPRNGHALIADSAGNIGTIVGKQMENWQSLNLASHPVTLTINSEQRATGHSGQSIAGNPLGMVAWLANDLAASGRSLKAGECIFCGTCSGMIEVNIGDHLHADLGALGSLSISLVEY